jgi:hypothetical protein
VKQLTEYCDVKYMGGHPEHPKSSDSRVYFYNDRIELENPELTIPFKSMVNIENADEKRISAFRVVMFGIIGALWKKKHLYTIIQYTDRSNERMIVIDFDDIVDIMQPFIYRRMIRFRRTTSLNSENNYLRYENSDYGFTIKYPESWYEDEFDQKNEGYTKVVEFRKTIEDRSPFVTIYMEQLSSKDKSAVNYISDGIKEIKNDASVSILEQSEIVKCNNSGIRLVDVDQSGYKRLVYWIPSNDKIFEISYSTEQEQYLEHLSVVEDMINSFQIVQATEQPRKIETIENTTEFNALDILKKRFASGEISEEDYVRMKRVLQE